MKLIELTDLPIADSSLHYRMESETGGFVDFSILNGEMCAYLWECPSKGRFFLKELEAYAEKNKLRLTIPTVLSARLEKILKDDKYTMKIVPDREDVCELWSKW